MAKRRLPFDSIDTLSASGHASDALDVPRKRLPEVALEPPPLQHPCLSPPGEAVAPARAARGRHGPDSGASRPGGAASTDAMAADPGAAAARWPGANEVDAIGMSASARAQQAQEGSLEWLEAQIAGAMAGPTPSFLAAAIPGAPL